ncbi:hypothetical protein DSCO28_50770 [Desulfosarcina ovata subsp. sediminis]|uniref:Integrase catalytic domain-containing protein n=1 Tax=Desulfosarcina ovata subsp. sediminis TaxID=885957 RepID=A0A5K7ZWM0_9BACT|nr:DDE-type integrase/transposase/recombinase [Desulfosarcina ovata]BBO84511.1 hypothetical protein DSCO28_50770 [Desulfosarcina ovata subsp. sediminis]
MSLSPNIIETVRCDWRSAPTGSKSKVVQRWSRALDCSQATIYRALGIGRNRKGVRTLPNVEACAQIVSQVKKKPPENHGEITTEQAIRIAVENGAIPKAMLGKASSFDRVMRDLGLNRKKRRIQRFQAEYPNQLHHVDASTSKCFYIHRELPDGDRVLRLHAGSKTGYKNKPVPIRERPWVYGLVDDHSGYQVARYIAAFGETAVDNLDFMQWAWSRTDEKTLFGLPDMLKGDLGPMMRGPAGQDFFDRLGITIDPSMPENKESHGKIERPWRTAWQRFEKPFFVQPDWRKFEISLSELNRRFLVYLDELNDRPHRYEKTISRRQAWQRINQRGGAVAIPENALATVARRFDRTVGPDGCFSIDNTIYEVKGLHDAKVFVYVGVFDGTLVVEDRASGEKYEVEDFKPNPVGTYTGHKHTPHQKARKEAEKLAVTNTLYMDHNDTGKVTPFPTRVRPAPAIDNPLSVNTYPSLSHAMKDFVAISGIVPDAETREALSGLIIENGLAKAFVRELALGVQAEAERSVKHG